MWRTLQALEHATDLAARQDHGQVDWPLSANDVVEPRKILLEHDPIEKQQRVEGLVLRGRSDPTLHGERGEEARDFGTAHLCGVTLAVEEDVALDPADVGLLGAAAVVAGTDRLTDAVEEAGLRRPDGGRLADGQHVRP